MLFHVEWVSYSISPFHSLFIPPLAAGSSLFSKVPENRCLHPKSGEKWYETGIILKKTPLWIDAYKYLGRADNKKGVKVIRGKKAFFLFISASL